MKPIVWGIALLTLPSVAYAGKCDAIAKKASSAQGDALVEAYGELLACDKNEAEMHFDAFMKASVDVSTLVDLTLVAIENESFVPVWSMMEKIPHTNREDVARGVGDACGEQDAIPTFLMGAHAGLRGVEFARWETALRSCESDTLDKWLEGLVAKPPESAFDEKYNVILGVYAKRKKAEALPTLAKAAGKAAKSGGPFNPILEHMNLAIQPDGIGEDPAAEDLKKLEASLVAVAKSSDKDHAKLVADRLYNAGAEEAAAGLLPTIYSDRLEGGKLVYGAAAVEACEKEAVIHWTTVTEGGKHWNIATALQQPMRDYKSKLKCDSGEWPIVFTPEPVKSGKAVKDFVDEVVADWESKGFDVKDKGEKDLSL